MYFTVVTECKDRISFMNHLIITELERFIFVKGGLRETPSNGIKFTLFNKRVRSGITNELKQKNKTKKDRLQFFSFTVGHLESLQDLYNWNTIGPSRERFQDFVTE